MERNPHGRGYGSRLRAAITDLSVDDFAAAQHLVVGALLHGQAARRRMTRTSPSEPGLEENKVRVVPTEDRGGFISMVSATHRLEPGIANPGGQEQIYLYAYARARARGENREKDGWEGRKDDARAAARGKRTTYRNMSQQHSSPGTAGGDAALPPAAHRYVGPADGAPPSAAASFAGSTCTRCFMDPVTMSVCSLCSRPLPSSLPPPSPSLRGRVSRRAARQAQPHRQQRVEFIAPRTGPVVSNFQRQQKVTAAQALNSECHTHAYYLYPRQAHGPGTDTTAQQSAVSSIVLRYCMEACGVPRPPTLT